jgi:hypothetical protein
MLEKVFEPQEVLKGLSFQQQKRIDSKWTLLFQIGALLL